MRHPFLAGVFAALLVLISTAAASAAEGVPAESSVRVLVAEKQKFIRVLVKGDYVVRALPSLQPLKKGTSLNLIIVPGPKGIRAGGQDLPAGVTGLRIESAGERDLLINKSRFRGKIDIRRDAAGTLYAINTLGMEGYLYGVLHHEVSAWWPAEALKAQAVAARTYALYQASVSRTQEYDLKSSTSSQVYGGSTTERGRTTRAVDQTAGQILKYEGKVFPAYFHATCAGTTAAAKELWNIDVPPLAGGVTCGYCKISPHFFWKTRVPLSEIEEYLIKVGRPLGRILEIRQVTQTPSGRVGSLRITGTAGESVIAAKDFRVWVGGNRMKSTYFKIHLKDDSAYFHGQGWGHGVGLCQWGVLGQALLGKKYQEMLAFYYPGGSIADYRKEAA